MKDSGRLFLADMSFNDDSRQSESMKEKTTLSAERPPRICVVGVGGAGNGVLDRLVEKKISGVDTVSISADPERLSLLKADRKLILRGAVPIRGLARCCQPIIGEMAARDQEEEIGEVVRRSDIVFLVAGLGCSVGTGAAPVVAEIARKQGALVICVCTLPFDFEGRVRKDNAIDALNKLRDASNTAVLIPMDGFTEIFHGVHLDGWFRVSNELLAEVIRYFAVLFRMPSEPDTNRESLSKIFKNGEIATIGMGESDSASESGLEDAAEEAITSPLLVLGASNAGYKYVPVGGKLIPVHVPPPVVPAKSVLITFWSDVDVPRDRVEKAIDLVRKGLPDRVVITSQTSPNQSLEGTARCMVMVTGVQLPEELKEKQVQTSGIDRSIDSV